MSDSRKQNQQYAIGQPQETTMPHDLVQNLQNQVGTFKLEMGGQEFILFIDPATHQFAGLRPWAGSGSGSERPWTITKLSNVCEEPETTGRAGA